MVLKSDEQVFMKKSDKIECPVAVHRWFAEGEGWAYEPSVDIGELVNALRKSVLGRKVSPEETMMWVKGERSKYFCVIRPDKECADPKAVNRRPHVLWVICWPSDIGLMTRREFEKSLREQLENLRVPDVPGPDGNLRITVSVPLSAGEERQIKGSRKWSIIWRVAVIGLVLVAGASLFRNLWYYGTKDEIEKARGLLKKVGETDVEELNGQKVAERLRKVFCQQWVVERLIPGANVNEVVNLLGRVHQVAAQYDAHPDLLFVKFRENELVTLREVLQHLHPDPQERSRLFLLGFLVDDVRQAALDAYKKNGQNRTDKEEIKERALDLLDKDIATPLSDLLGRLKKVDQSDFRGLYEQWFSQNFMWESGKPFPWNKRSDLGASEIARLCCKRKESELGLAEKREDVAKEMLRLLKGWGVEGIAEEDCMARPWFVGWAFVEFLSLKHFTNEEINQLEKEESAPAIWLREYLPKEPLFLPKKQGTALTNEELWSKVEDSLKEGLAPKFGIDSRNGNQEMVKAIDRVIKEYDALISEGRRLSPLQREELKRQRQEEKEELQRLQRDLVQLTEEKQYWEQRGDYKEADERVKKINETEQEVNKIKAKLRRLGLLLASERSEIASVNYIMGRLVGTTKKAKVGEHF